MPDSPATSKAVMASAPFVHVVLFKLPENAEAEEKAELLDDIRAQLAPLPQARVLMAGSPAPTKSDERSIIDDDYDVGLLVLFKDQAELQDYLDDPVHGEFARKHDTRCTVRVFDFT